jgi:cysteine desulfurase
MSLETSERRYFDWASTAMPGGISLDGPFGNPSSRHREGREARIALERARETCAGALGAAPGQIYFTSGATESNALVLFSRLLQQSRGTILFSGGEHPSIRENCRALERLGKGVGVIGIDKTGRVSPETLGRALKKYPDARFAAIMAVNNELGGVSDLPVLAEILREKGIFFHCDIVQGLGKIPIDLALMDSASLSGHKLGSPRGIGLLYLRKALVPLCAGGGQEKGIRPGTENVAGAIALGEYLKLRAEPNLIQAEYTKAAERFGLLIAGLKRIPACVLIPEDRQEEDSRFSPYILQAACRGIPGEVMVRALDDAGFAISTGSACSSGGKERPVLQAIGADPQTSLEGFRISQGWTTAKEDIQALLGALQKIAVQWGKK